MTAKEYQEKVVKKVKKTNQPEFILQREAANWLDNFLHKGVYTSHDSSLGLGILVIRYNDSITTKACKKFYNCFIIGAQRNMGLKGVKKGWGDMVIHFERIHDKTPVTLWVEFKAGYNKQLPEQEQNGVDLKAIGIPKLEIRSVEQLAAELRRMGADVRGYHE